MAKKKIKREVLADLLNNIAFLVGVGFTPLRATQSLCTKEGNKKKDSSADELEKAAKKLIPYLYSGGSLEDAFSVNDSYFMNISTRVGAGERSGKLPEALRRIADQVQRGSEIAGKIKSALIYPAAILILTIGIAWYLFAKLLPQIFNEMKEVVAVDMPAITMTLLDMVDFFNKYGWLVLIILVSLIVLIIYLAKGPLKMQAHKLYTKIPIIGKIIKDTNAVNYYDSLNFMLFAGVALNKAMDTAAMSANNLYLRAQFQRAAYLYTTLGCSLDEALFDVDVLSQLELETISAGYISNQLFDVLKDLSHRREVARVQTLDRAIALIEPVTMAFAGVMVGVLAVAVYMPLMNFGAITG